MAPGLGGAPGLWSLEQMGSEWTGRCWGSLKATAGPQRETALLLPLRLCLWVCGHLCGLGQAQLC